MIQRSPARIEVRDQPDQPRWQKELANAIRCPHALLRRLSLPDSLLEGARTGHDLFPIRIPEPYAARIEPGNPADPLLRQVLPMQAETAPQPGYSVDPLAETGAEGGPGSADNGLIHKYQSRALLIVTGACAINCRYCFRRHFPYEDHQVGGSQWDKPLQALAQDERINEVVLSGGDPLAMGDRPLGRLAERLARIPHIRRLRIHSRLPVVIPQRVNDELLSWLGELALQRVLVVHINHPNEIDQAVRQAMRRLHDAGVTLLNQAVLLRGVNDEADTLEQLSESLFEAGVMPYYLHAFDPVSGASHYDCGDARARELSRELLNRLPGYLVPRLVREVPGKPAKWPLDLGLVPEQIKPA